MNIQEKTRSAIDQLRVGNPGKAEQIFREIMKVQPNNVSALHFIGVICYQRKEYDSAIAYIKKALQFGPDYADAHNNLGTVFQETGRLDEAIACYQNALRINPSFERAHYNLGTAFMEKWQIDDAIIHFRKAIQLNPDFPEVYNKMGNALQDQGKLIEAEECYRYALRLNPLFTYFDNFLMMLNYNSSHDAQSVFTEHLRYSKQVAEPLYPAVMRHGNDRSPSRRLKIGYVSPDFRRHSVNYFLEPVLAAHGHEQFKVFCYSDVLAPDTVTERLKGYADQWRTIAGMPDEQVAEMIRKDGIDILIDLAGHTANNRLLLFARKPAPVQVSWLGYPNTTGLKTMDYRIVDGNTDPEGMTDPYYTEKLVRMPESFLCYQPDRDSPAVGDLPTLKSGHVTFGSFNYFPKASPETIALWAAILKAVPGSRLVMKTRNFSDRTARGYALDMFAGHGVAAGRIELLSMKMSFEQHLDTYNRIDVALDTFPYNGTTTTCEALWMGVPVITLAGNMHASRVGVSILSNIGFPELIAETPDEYVNKAVNLANDIARLRLMRERLREVMRQSPLMNAERFAANLENCYREMWRNYCAG